MADLLNIPGRFPGQDVRVLAVWGLIAVACLAATGCRGEYRLAKVSGTVTLDGKPAPGIEVRFQPTASGGNVNPGPGSMGVSGADGRYTLVVQDASLRPGAVVGKHVVFLAVAAPPSDPKSDATPPPQACYRQQAFEVPPRGTNQADFALEPDTDGASITSTGSVLAGIR